LIDPDVNVETYAKRWLEIVRATVKPATYASYANTLRLHIVPVFGRTKVRHLQRGAIRAWLARGVVEGYARDSVRVRHATLRSMLNVAIDDGLISANPADKLARQLRLTLTTAHRQEQIKAMTREQLTTFLATAERTEPRLYPLFLALARTGMRLGEGLALQWEDLDLGSRALRVARGFSRGRLETPKSGVGRTVDMSQQLARVLRRLQVKRAQEKLRRGWKEMPPWVFCTHEATPYDHAFVQRLFKRVLKSAKLSQHFSPHCLRHTYASQLLQTGVSPVYVQRQLGHASIKMTVDTYGKWLPMEQTAVVDRLDDQAGSKMVAARTPTAENTSRHSQLQDRISVVS